MRPADDMADMGIAGHPDRFVPELAYGTGRNPPGALLRVVLSTPAAAKTAAASTP